MNIINYDKSWKSYLNLIMANINKSFLYGTCFASITWIISIYFYLTLVKEEPNTIEEIYNTRAEGHKNWIDIRKAYVNSEHVKKNLAPVFNKPVNIAEEIGELGLVKTMEDQLKKDHGYKYHAYNIFISEQLGLHRKIPDTRNELCKNISYGNLPAVSIVVCFYNEHYTTLLRTVHSILDRTPSHLLHEIILVDDFSDLDNTHENLQIYLNEHPNTKIKLLKTPKREGLIRARIFGAHECGGEVIIFLDSHVEVNVGWVEPLLSRVKANRKNVALPIIDIINADTFAYSSSPLVRGGFNWGLHFKWENLPKGTLSQKENFVKPIKSPTMAGGLFAMNRSYFMELGEYDPGMDIWGGENLEISFRVIDSLFYSST